MTNMESIYKRDSEQRLIKAVSTIVEEHGFSKVGINRIARTAECDKVLIYRYFGGLDGLIAAWAKENDFYISAYDAFRTEVETISKDRVKDLAKRILIAQLHFLRENRMMQELIIWELTGHSKFKILQEIREKNGYKLQQVLSETAGIDKEENINMYVLILVAAIEFIVICTRNYQLFNGVNFGKSESWEKFEDAICNFIDQLFNTIEL